LAKLSFGAYEMFVADLFALLGSRRIEIGAEVTELSERLDMLKAEDEELASAERVLIRFGAIPVKPAGISNFGMGKPFGTLTTPNMIIVLLREAAFQGKVGLEPKEMQISISKRWWPTVKSEDVGPTAWRMWKDGRLEKTGSLYYLC
jgi:hypothetical protein